MKKNEVDVFIGAKVRERRIFLGLTQLDVAKIIGLSYQQVQKYESGRNSISSSRLFELSKIFKIDIAHFFEGAMEKNEGRFNQATKKEAALLLKAFKEISKPDVRKVFISLIRTINKSADDTDLKSTITSEAA